ncbi:unnamed protein product [Rotaria sordida]|nr:unnamed protein product [Rotaria sordida]CAF0743894.1 unnamed protein product [Rotaria sordida]CAF0745258.1 unnamed protein product [Rotaria sordida]CAF0790175.1 unnamed protein product [Rotaria sordida]
MQIFVRTLDDRTLTLNVQPDDTINEIKEIVEQREGIPADEQRLTLGGISLDDELTLNECHVEEESTLYVLLDLEGGGKKRKKKSYSTPKKNKHKRKKVKLAVLKYYKVEDSGKIRRLRRECPSKQCGAGVFMAAHHDRNYCGKCCVTYMFTKREEENYLIMAATQMKTPLNPRPYINELVGKKILVRLKWGMTYVGVLVSVDQYMNVQLGNAVEYIDEQNKGPLGEILIRCNNILYISGIDEVDEDEDAMA